MNYQDRVFRRITIDTHFSVATIQQATISWAMQPTFNNKGPWTFTLQRGLSPTDDQWEDIAVTIDQPWAYDNRPILNKLGVPVYYRVKLVDGDGQTFYSQAQETTAFWTRYDWTLARDIVRKENLILQKKTGTKGYLLKRRYFGERCPVCSDDVTGQVTTESDSRCFGTGITGGYYTSMDYWITLNATQRMRRLTPDQGVVSATIETGRALAYPTVQGNDIWVNAFTNTRYIIKDDVKVIAKYRGIPVIVDVTLEELPAGHIIYQVPTNNIPSTLPSATATVVTPTSITFNITSGGTNLTAKPIATLTGTFTGTPVFSYTVTNGSLTAMSVSGVSGATAPITVSFAVGQTIW